MLMAIIMQSKPWRDGTDTSQRPASLHHNCQPTHGCPKEKEKGLTCRYLNIGERGQIKRCIERCMTWLPTLKDSTVVISGREAGVIEIHELTICESLDTTWEPWLHSYGQPPRSKISILASCRFFFIWSNMSGKSGFVMSIADSILVNKLPSPHSSDDSIPNHDLIEKRSRYEARQPSIFAYMPFFARSSK